MFPIVLFVVAENERLSTWHRAMEYNGFKFDGTASDILKNSILTSYWCRKNELKFGYTSRNSDRFDDVHNVMKNFGEKFENKKFRLDLIEYSDESDLIYELREDLKNGSFEKSCDINTYIGGVVFDEIDRSSKILKYRILIPDGQSKHDWMFGEEWRFPYGGEQSENRIPTQPPYSNSGFLTLQHAVETSFVEAVKGERINNTEIRFKGLPEAEHVDNILAKFIAAFPTLFAFITFVNVMHVSRNIASENECVKPYLSAMGLSTSMFYLNHILVAFAKYLPLLLVTILPLGAVVKHASLSTIFTVLLIYGVGIITFGALIASLFKNGNSAVKFIVIIWALMVLFALFLAPGTDQITKCFFYGLNINGAFNLAIQAISGSIKRERSLDLSNMFDDSTHWLSLGFALLLMIFDVVWMFALTIYIDRNGSEFTIRDIFKIFSSEQSHGSKVSQKVNELELSALLEGANEIDGARSSARAGISVRNLVKKWGTTGERAVDGLTFEAKQGQVSILLGHNGAGKSTTFQSIAGIVKPTEGQILIYGKDVSRGVAYQNIGLCPQYNPLYDKLTVEEHLWLIYGFRGKTSIMNFEIEMEKLLKDVKLADKRTELAMNLSGGMKRKLCVCMALIGQSNVVLLDEPTAGMDPGARKDVQDLLEREKKERTILLTTHYMDEAERLGDWILIMSHGKLVSSGTTKFLKQKYGTGYLLTVVLDVHGDKEKMGDILEQVSKFYVSGAQLGERHGQQIEIILPEVKKDEFRNLFKAIEAIQTKKFNNDIFSKIPALLKDKLKNLGITSYGLSLNTLEQVFITIGDKVEQSMNEPMNCTKKIDDGKKCFERFVESQEVNPGNQVLSLIIAQISAIFRKKYLYTIRNYTNLLIQIITPIILLIIFASMTRFSGEKASGVRNMRLPPTRYVWLYDPRKQSDEANKMQKILAKDPDSFEILRYYETNSLLDIMLKLKGDIPPIAFGFTHNYTLFNLRCYHILPPLISLHNRARLIDMENLEDFDPPVIEASLIVYSSNNVAKISTEMWAKILFVPFVILIFTMLTSSFVMFLVEERVSKYGHQQLLTGISPITFYGASFAFDFMVFFTICMVFVGIVMVTSLTIYNFGIIIHFCFLYFFSSVPFIYAISLLIESPSKANVLLIIWQIVISGVAIMFTYSIVPAMVSYLNFDITFIGYFKTFCYFILPSFSFGTSVIFASLNDKTGIELLQWDKLGKTAALMLGFGAFASILFVGLQFRKVRKILARFLTLPKKRYLTMPSFELPSCEAVKLEEEKVKSDSREEYAMIGKGLTKKYGRFTAIDNLSLAIEEKECFGLLGVNGAGKTTTFNILTGQSFATSGEARIGGRDVTDRIPIGYCPQFDALLLDLTGREVLEILGQMHGFANYREKADLVLECVGMRQNADKLVRYYSGGQKRKISVGVALLAPTQMIILDEPTAGIDPKARREVWELLIWCRENSNSALMLTSHSMDECEALCSRIAVLNKGKLIAIGTSQELKSLYGNSYTMTLTLNDPEDRDNIINQVRNLLPYSVLRTSESNKTVNLVWRIPKKPDDQWSEKFEMVQSLAKQLNVKDYILSQSSLEETFLQLAASTK